MKIPLFNTPLEKIIISKGMIAGIGLIVLGIYVMRSNSEFGYGIILNGLAVLGIRDKIA